MTTDDDDKWTPCPSVVCKKCGQQGSVVYRESGDGAYTDTQYRCTACNGSWWVDGADA